MTKTALITGASSGIGKACALKFAGEGWKVILNGRRKGHLEDLGNYIKNEFNGQAYILPFNVSDKQAVFKAIEKLPEEWKKIDLLINNAGLAAGADPIHKGSTDDWDTMIDTNLKGLLYVTKAVVNGMVERKEGHIINIGSIAAKDTYPKGNVYCGTKRGVEAITNGMRIDLLEYNIKVSLINPGATETEFSLVRYKGDKEKAESVYKGYTPLYGEDVAQVIYFAANLPPHVNINDLLLMPTAQASAVCFNKKHKT